LSALTGALTWGYADISSGQIYTNHNFWYWNIFVSFCSLLIFGMAVRTTRDSLRKNESARKELQRAVDELKASIAQTERLREQLHVICAWTKRIRINGQWLTLEEFLKNHFKVSVSHGISPEAIEQMVAREKESTHESSKAQE
jgi:hypothetical protein